MTVVDAAPVIDLTKVIVALIGLLGTVLTSVLIPYIRAKTATAKKEDETAHIDAENAKRNDIQTWIRIAVMAAEMMFKTPGSGAEKLDFVMKYINRLLTEKGYSYDEQQIRIMIESELLELKKTLLSENA